MGPMGALRGGYGGGRRWPPDPLAAPFSARGCAYASDGPAIAIRLKSSCFASETPAAGSEESAASRGGWANACPPADSPSATVACTSVRRVLESRCVGEGKGVCDDQ
jgi:hypothetical protein